MIKINIFKRIVLIFAISAICTTIIGCSHTDNQDEQHLIESTGEETNHTDAIKETASDSEKQITIAEIKKRAEENAEKDRINTLEGLGNAETDNRRDEAMGYIIDSFPDYFSSDTLLEKSIEYGHYIRSIYKDSEGVDNGGGRYFAMGKLVSEAAQDIYAGTKTSTDDSVAERLQELEALLQNAYGQYYGGYEGDGRHPAERILISEHPVLHDNPYFTVILSDVLSSSYQEYYSPETEGGYLHFFEEPGIIYVTGESSREADYLSKRLKGVVLTDPKYEFGCGLKVGLTVQELMDMDIIFNDSSLESIPNYIFLPFLKEKFDCDSVYIATEEISYDVRFSYIVYRFLVFVKDDQVIAVSIDDAAGDLDAYEWEPSATPSK